MSAGVLTRLREVFGANRTSWIGLVLFAAICATALFAPWIATTDPLEQSIIDKLQPPSGTHWFGTDEFGRDVFARIVWGARISLIVAVASISLALVIGGTIGLVSGYIGGRFDMLVMQAMDVLLSFPALILGLIIVALLGPSLTI